MWRFQFDELTGGRGLVCTVHSGAAAASVADVLGAWQADATFRSSFNSALADSPFTAFRWETPGVTESTVSRPFEFVLLDSPGLAEHPDPSPFREHFAQADDGVVVFSNLGGDATLVVPCPLAEPHAYGHLASFVRLAPEAQQHALWQAVGNAVQKRLGSQPVWLSTAGGGVSWLHVRLDDRPKYYGHQPCRQLK